jgi:hypothetical protein
MDFGGDMILTLISMFGGGLMRLLPEIFSFLNKKTDNAHELAMLEKQFQLEATREASKRETILAQGDIDQTLALLAAQKSAIEGQMQKVGIWWVDALNFLVRPLTTYYFLFLYGAYKTALLMVALQGGAATWASILQVYDAEDRAILSGILAFWFVGRVFEKQK